MKTCESCAFYQEHRNMWGARWMECSSPVVEDAILVTVADDHNLNVSFRPPHTFGCRQHEEKA